MKLPSIIKIKDKRTLIFISLNLLVILGILLLPYYLFGGRLFLGGDDTRLYYVFPNEFLNTLALYSWNNISSLPYHIPNHYWLPFLFTFSVIGAVVSSKTLIFYFAFSSVLILGFIYFQKFIYELIGKKYEIGFVSSLIYILSPITLVTLSFFLSPVWLISLIPIVFYYYLRYVKHGQIKDLVKIVVWSIFFSFVYFSISWILAIAVSFLPSLLLIPFLGVDSLFLKVKRTIIFGFFIASSQLFWIIPFFSSIYYGGQSSLREKVESNEFAISFANTILSTATGNIVYPLLMHYQRRIAFDYDWQLKNVFVNYYDFVLPFSAIFILVLLFGLVMYRKNLDSTRKKFFVFFLLAFIIVLYFSTVNIGFLKNLFLVFGNVPGFAILRNFTDKFSLAYIFIFSTFLALCFLVIKKNIRYYSFALILVLIVVIINVLPIKRIIAAPLWKTDNLFTTLNFPKEYLSFTNEARRTLPSTSNVIAFPQNIASYSIITEENGTNSYVGTSPFKFLTGINDLSGSGSYPNEISKNIENLVTNKRYSDLLSLLEKLNVGYVMVTNNIPDEALNSYLFDSQYLQNQNEQLIQEITEEEIIRSTKGNYLIYKLNNNATLFTSSAKIKFQKLSPVEYEILLSNLNIEDELYFKETYHLGWKLFSGDGEVFKNSHSPDDMYGNKWLIESEEEELKLKLYFTPQNHYNIGVAVTVLLLSIGFVLLFITRKNEKNR